MFSLAELATRLSKTDISGWMKGQPANQLKQSNDWVEAFLGFPESSAVSKGTQLETKQSIDAMLSKYAIYDVESGVLATPQGKYQAGWFVCPTVDEIKAIVASLDGVLKKGKPRVRIDQGVDAGGLITNGPQLGIYQAASQANGLEMISPMVLPRDGIKKYEGDPTQGPVVAMTGGPGTFVRGYWVGQQMGGQFNSLYELNLDHVNGYLIWGTDSASVRMRFMNSEGKIRIPAMLYTQVVGKTRAGHHLLNKLVHQIYSCSAPVGAYGNDASDGSLNIAKTLLTAAYTGTIGLGLILKAWDAQRGVNNPINLTLVGGGAFNNPSNVIVDAIGAALAAFAGYDFDVVIHDYRGDMIPTINTKLYQYIAGVPGGPGGQAAPPFGVQAAPPFGQAPGYGAAPAPPFGQAPGYGAAPAPLPAPPFGQAPGYGAAPAPLPAPGAYNAPGALGQRMYDYGEPDLPAFVPVQYTARVNPGIGQGGIEEGIPAELLPAFRALSVEQQQMIHGFMRDMRSDRHDIGPTPKSAKGTYMFNKFLNMIARGIKGADLAAPLRIQPYTLNLADTEAKDYNGQRIPGALWGLGQLNPPIVQGVHPNRKLLDIYLAVYDAQTRTYNIWSPRPHQIDMIVELYNMRTPTQQYAAGAYQYDIYTAQPILNKRNQHMREVEAYLFKYLGKDYPIMGYENEDGNKIYIIDIRYHEHPADPLRPIKEITNIPPAPGFKALSARTGRYETDPKIIFGLP